MYLARTKGEEMTTDVGNVWSWLGRPDYSIAAGLVASLPQEVRNDLNSSERGVLTSILHLCWTYASKSGRGKAYCIPSQSYLGKAIDRCARTVRRAIDYLVESGLLTSVRRKPVDNQPQTNIYGLGQRLLAVVYASVGKKPQQFRNRTKVSDNDLKKGIERANPEGARSIDRKEEKVTPLAPPSVPSGLRQGTDAAPRKEEGVEKKRERNEPDRTLDPVWTPENYRKSVERYAARKQQENQVLTQEKVKDRLALLKAQAQMLKARGL